MEKSPFIDKQNDSQTSKLIQNIPDELKNLKQWVCFDLVSDSLNSKPKKVPKNPHNGLNASHSDPKTWGSFKAALEGSKKHNYPHIGFAFTKNDPYTGIDLDNCISDIGEFNEFAMKILERFQSTYIEYSLSKKGFHIIIKGNIDKGRKNPSKGIEIYSCLRFFVMTGDILQNHPIAEMQSQLDSTYNEFFPTPKQSFNKISILDLPDQIILKKAFQAKNGKKFQSLFNGELELYDQDHSTADLALCCLLAFWTKDHDQIDRIFRQSHLYRKKWNRMDYRNATINKAINMISNGYKDNLYAQIFNLPHFLENEENPDRTNTLANPVPVLSIKKFEFLPVAQMINSPPKSNWLIKKYMDKGSLVVLFGDPGSMKSFLVIDMGLSIAANQNWHENHILKQGPVLYIAGEGFEGISRRIFAWSIFHKIDLSDVPFFTSTSAAQFLDVQSALEVEKAINQIYSKHGPPSLVIVDTLNRNYGPGDENSGQDMTIFVNKMFRLIKIYDCTILVVHHSGTVAKDRARGSCVLRGAADWEYNLKKSKTGIITLTSTKSKDYEPPLSITFNHKCIDLDGWHDDEGEVMTSCILQRDKGIFPKIKSLNAPAKKALSVLIAIIEENRVDKITINQWRDAVYHSGITSSTNPDTRKKAFQRIREELCDLEYIEINSEYCWLKRDKGHDGTNTGHVPFEKAGQTGHVSLDICPDIPIG